MTVQELIEKLRTCDPNADVVAYDTNNYDELVIVMVESSAGKVRLTHYGCDRLPEDYNELTLLYRDDENAPNTIR